MIAKSFYIFILFSTSLFAFAEDSQINCTLKAKAIQAGSFWGGTYFDTSVTSEKIESLVIKSSIDELKSGQVKNASAKLVVKDHSILEAKKNDGEVLPISYSIQWHKRTRSVSSEDESIQLKTEIKFQDETFKKEFNVVKGHKSYIHFDVDEPSLMDFKITNLFMICSAK